MGGLGFEERLNSFKTLGKILETWAVGPIPNKVQVAFDQAMADNPWFTERWIRFSFKGLAWFLSEDALNRWAASNPSGFGVPKKVGNVALVLAGNIPAVGFADIFYVLMSGHRALIKYASRDKALLSFLLQELSQLEPSWKEQFSEATTPLKDFDAVIVTGNADTARTLDHYFRAYPRIVRGHRQSVAVLTGLENHKELEGLALDMVAHFGLGCRNVTMLLVPKDYDFGHLAETLEAYKDEFLQHHRFKNNYDYQKTLLLLNRIPHYAAGPLLLVPSENTLAPVSVVHYTTYENHTKVFSFLESHTSNIQAVVSAAPWVPGAVSPGKAQFPEPGDYADGVNVAEFLASLQGHQNILHLRSE
ncbi:MAG: acyl-CoA reductase [Flavobacteriales bacterium]|nr:acyl-CoA reductase [Flavobacteriales bacterium]